MELMPPFRKLYLRVSVTDRCNLRCLYCRTGNGRNFVERDHLLSDEDILELVRLVKEALPIYKLRVTGGDPLVRPNLSRLIGRLRVLLPNVELAITTNGLLLSRLAKDLKKAGLDSINVSLDTLNPLDFGTITGVGALSEVQEGILAAKSSGFKKIKLNAVLLRSFNGDSLSELALFSNALGCELRMIELMPIGIARNHFEQEFMSGNEALEKLSEHFGSPVHLGLSGTARRYLFSCEGRRIPIGIITTISEPFCTRCDRLRLDARGWLYPCLHDYEGIDLLMLLKNEKRDLVKQRIRAAHSDKKNPVLEWTSLQMVRIGG